MEKEKKEKRTRRHLESMESTYDVLLCNETGLM